MPISSNGHRNFFCVPHPPPRARANLSRRNHAQPQIRGSTKATATSRAGSSADESCRIELWVNTSPPPQQPISSPLTPSNSLVAPALVNSQSHWVDRDLLVATDDKRYKTRTVAPVVPLCDGAGVIERVNAGPDSSRWQVGDRVLVAAASDWKSAGPGTDGEMDNTRVIGASDIDGVLQQYVVANEDAIIPAPDSLSFEEVACLGGAYATAWNALYGWYITLKKDDVIVVQGTGGTSTAVLQASFDPGAACF